MLDHLDSILYSYRMNEINHQEEPVYPTLAVSAGRKILRFVLAGITALLIVFITLLFMRFLVKGYDDKASSTLTRYISLPSLTIHRRSYEEEKPIKPLLQPELELDEISDLAEKPDETETELAIESPASVPGLIETEIILPGLEDNGESDRKKLQQIKEALTNSE